MSEQSTTEGQPEVELEHVLGSKEGNETPRNLEAENEPESLQNLESSVSQDEGLEKALNESGEGQAFEVQHPQMDTSLPPSFLGGKMAPAIIHAGEFNTDRPFDQLQPPLGGATFPTIGVQPDGSEKFVITVQEGYTDAVRQWAEADGVPVERWLSDRLYEYISTYGEPAKGR